MSTILLYFFVRCRIPQAKMKCASTAHWSIYCLLQCIYTETRHLGVAKRARTIRSQGKRAQSKKDAEQKERRAKRAQNKKGARSRCCVTITFKVVISSDNRVLSQFFFFFFFL